MSRATFKILFYLKRNAPKKNGLIPVMCRITVNGKIAQFSCKLDVEEKMWSVETGRLTGRSNVALEGNRMLDKIRVGVNKAYQDVFDRDTYVTAEKERNEYLSMRMNHMPLLAVFRQHNEDYAKLVGKMKSQRSYWKYCVVYKHLSEFIKTRYKVEDIALKELAPAFITDFELFLRVESLIRRYRGYHGKGDAPTVIDALEINRDKGTVCKNGRAVEMPKTEFEQLQYLIANRGPSVSARKL